MPVNVTRQRIESSIFTTTIIPGAVYNDPVSPDDVYYFVLNTKTPPYSQSSWTVNHGFTLNAKGGTGSDSLAAVITSTSPSVLEDIVVGDVVTSTLPSTTSPTPITLNDCVYQSGLPYFVVPTSVDITTLSKGSVVDSPDLPPLTGGAVPVIDRVDVTGRRVFVGNSITGLEVNFVNTGVGNITVNPRVRVQSKNSNTLQLSVNYTGTSPTSLSSVSFFRGITELPTVCFRFAILNSNTLNNFSVQISQNNPSSNNALISARTPTDFRNLTYTPVTTRQVDINSLLLLVGNRP